MDTETTDFARYLDLWATVTRCTYTGIVGAPAGRVCIRGAASSKALADLISRAPADLWFAVDRRPAPDMCCTGDRFAFGWAPNEPSAEAPNHKTQKVEDTSAHTAEDPAQTLAEVNAALDALNKIPYRRVQPGPGDQTSPTMIMVIRPAGTMPITIGQVGWADIRANQ